MGTIQAALREPIRLPAVRTKLSADELLLHLQALRLRHAQRTDCPPGAPLAVDQEVVFDGWLLSGPNPLPRSGQTECAIVLSPAFTESPFLFGLVGRSTGTEQRFALPLGDRYPLSELRGATVTQVAKLARACRVVLPAAEDPQFWRATGLGASLEEVLAAVRRRLDAARLAERARTSVEVVLVTLASRLGFEPSSEVLVKKKAELFEQTELPTWVRLGLSPQDQSRARAAWGASPTVERWAIQSLAITVALGELKGAGLIDSASLDAAPQVLKLPCVKVG